MPTDSSANAASQAAELDQALGANQDQVEVEALDGSRTVIQIRPLKIRQLSGLLRSLNDLANAGVDVTDLGTVDYAKLLVEGGDVAISFLAELITPEPDPLKRPHALKESAVLIGNQNTLDGANLVAAVYRVNKSFFAQNADRFLAGFGLTPEQSEAIKAKIAGVTSSLSSSPTATNSLTSLNTP